MKSPFPQQRTLQKPLLPASNSLPYWKVFQHPDGRLQPGVSFFRTHPGGQTLPSEKATGSGFTDKGSWFGKCEAQPFRWLPIGVQHPQASLPIPDFIHHLENEGVPPLSQGQSTGHITVSSQGASFEGR